MNADMAAVAAAQAIFDSAETSSEESGDSASATETPAPAAEVTSTPEHAKPAAPSPQEIELAVQRRARVAAQQRRDQAEKESAKLIQEATEKAKSLESKYSGLSKRLEEDPLATLKELGVNIERLFEKAVEQPEKLSPTARLAEELAEVKALLKKKEQEETDTASKRQKAQAEATARNAKQSFISHVAGKAESFPALEANFSGNPGPLADEAYSLARQYKEEMGQWPDFDEVAAFLEKKYLEEFQQKKARIERIAPKPEVGEDGSTKTPATLTNRDAASRNSKPKKSTKDMTPQEREAEAERAANEVIRALGSSSQ